MSGYVGGLYERLFELPEIVVLAVLWLLGAVLEGTCVAALALMGRWCVRTLLGA